MNANHVLRRPLGSKAIQKALNELRCDRCAEYEMSESRAIMRGYYLEFLKHRSKKG
jgi:hypothetical protein